MLDPKLYGHGWCPEPASDRDLTLEHDDVHRLVKKTGVHVAAPEHLPARFDLRKWCSPIRFQGLYQTCQAHVVASMIELLEKRAHDDSVDLSRLFIYQTARRLIEEKGSPGIYIRQTMGAVALLGVPPEKYWPYLETGPPKKPKGGDPRIEDEPDAFCYAVARNFGALKYYRLDPESTPKTEVLDQIRAHVAGGLSSSIGFPMHSGVLHLRSTIDSGRIPYTTKDDLLGNHAVLIVGYDDDLVIENSIESTESKGAFLIKNTWSELWGEGGYGWLPYEYLLENHAKDCWTMIGSKWLDTERFGLDLKEVELPAQGKMDRAGRTPTALS